MASKKPLKESPMAAYDEGKRLLQAITQFISGHRQEIVNSQLKSAAQNLLSSMQSLLSGMEQLSATEAVRLNLTHLRKMIREEIVRLHEEELPHREGDVWYDGTRAKDLRRLFPWGGRYGEEDRFFPTKKSAERYAQTGKGAFDEKLEEAEKPKSYGNVNPLSNPQYPDREKNAQLSMSRPTQGQLQEPWHKQLDGYVADVSEFPSAPYHHPVTNRPLKVTDMKPVKDREGDVTMWQGVVDGVKLTIFND